MKIAYLLNAYPMTSTTFIRREIEAHERDGHHVDRFAIRRWDQELVDPKDKAEANNVLYLLEQSPIALLSAPLRELVTNPVGTMKAIGATLKMVRDVPGRRLKQFAYLIEAFVLKRRLTALKIDHLHTHFSTNSATVAMLSRLMGGPAYSMTVHGPDELFEMKENTLDLKVHHAAFVAAITGYCKQTVDTYTGSKYTDKIHVVRCGLDLAEFQDQTEVPDTQTLVCVGRLCEAKAQVLLVEAIAETVKKHPKVKLILIGDGELRPKIESKIDQLNLHNNVVLAGWKQNAEVRDALLDARALVLPSLAEGLPVVIMESYALYRPVLTTAIFGIPELVDSSCGWLALPGNLDSLVTALDELLSADTSSLTRMGQIGQEKVEKFHDQDSTACALRNHILDFHKRR